MKRESISNLSGHEAYYTACSLLVISKNSCSRFHCQKGFNSILFPYQIGVWLEVWDAGCRDWGLRFGVGGEGVGFQV